MRNAWVLLLAAVPVAAGPETARTEFAEALRCEARGLPDAAALHHARVLAFEPDHRASRRALGFERADARWVLPAARRAAVERRLHARGAEARAAALAVLDLLEGETRLQVFAIAAGNAHADVRLHAVRALRGARGTPVLKLLARRAVSDPDAAVRAAAVDGIRAARREHASRLLTPHLRASEAAVRVYAAEALGALGDRDAVGPLVAYLSVAGGSTQRSYIAQTTQTAYIRDFDVEVA